jgi:Protein of unknown function (DUF3551)
MIASISSGLERILIIPRRGQDWAHRSIGSSSPGVKRSTSVPVGDGMANLAGCSIGRATGRNSMMMMRAALILVAVATLAGLINLRSAGAEIYRPWCVQYGGNNGDNGTTCAFTSFEQCMMTARGSGAFCVQNPWYLRYGGGQKGPESTGQGGRSKRR